MSRYNLSHARMADLLRTPEGTFKHWLYEGTAPPACMLVIMELLETSPSVRRQLGVSRPRRGAPRGKPFKPGNKFRFKKEKV